MVAYVKLLTAVAWASVAAAAVWAGAFLDWTFHRPAPPPSIKAPSLKPSSLKPRNDTVIVSAIGKTYHWQPTCFYVRQIAKDHRRETSQSEAEASGKTPCSNCLSIARSAPGEPLARSP